MRRRAGDSARRLAPWLALAALAWGVAGAIRAAWLCDDAFISFRYAENLVRGLGLVYNAGERVEGYSNFLWTLWIAVGMLLGAPPEAWSMAWGVACYAGTLAVLALHHRDFAARGEGAMPIALLAAAVHPDLHVYATSGLETSAFTLLATLACVVAVRDPSARGRAACGLVLALAAMTRPDGVLLLPPVAAYAALAGPQRVRGLAWLAGAFALAWLPYLAWKLPYYGELVTNTWHAKSAALAWWDQGWRYVRLYFERYGAVALAVPLGAVAVALPGPARVRGAVALALALALVYTLYVARVGGDFMYARLLIPATPLYLIALERSVARLARRPLVEVLAAAAVVAAIALAPMPLRGIEERHGIVDEPRVYTREALAKTRAEGETLRRYFDGLPVRVAFVGSQAALAYYARPSVAIEAQTGLTDAWIARRPLARRGRPGHEKVAPVSYLIERRVHFTIHHFAARTLDLDAALPFVAIAFDSVPGRILRWEPELMAELKRRGAHFVDVPIMLEQYAATLDRLTDAEARDAYARVRRFYFGHVRDPAREAPFIERLRRAR